MKRSLFGIIAWLILPALAGAAPDWTVSLQELDLSKLRPLDLALKTNWGGVNPRGDHLAANAEYLERNGKPWIMVSGEMHPARYPCEDWEEQILKMKAGGLNTISAYIFPSMHEEV